MDTSRSSKKSKSSENSKAFDKSIESFLFETAGSRKISLPFWQMVVSENPKSWENIRSGSLNSSDYKSIWNLVIEQDNSFMNAQELSQFLSICWEKLNSIDQDAVLVFCREKDLVPRILTFVKENASSGDISQILTNLLIEATNMSKEGLSEVRKEFEKQNTFHVLMDNAIKHPDRDETVVYVLVLELIYVLEGSGFAPGGKLIHFVISALQRIAEENNTRAFESLNEVKTALDEVVENPLMTIRRDKPWKDLKIRDEVHDMLAYVQCESVVRKSIFALRTKNTCLQWLLFLRLLLTESYNFDMCSFERPFGRKTMRIFIQALGATEMHLEELRSEIPRVDNKNMERRLQAFVMYELFEAIDQRVRKGCLQHKTYTPIRSLLSFPLGLHPFLRKLAFDTDQSLSDMKREFHNLMEKRSWDVKLDMRNTVSWEHFERKPHTFFETDQKESSKDDDDVTVHTCGQMKFMQLLQLMNLLEKYPGKISLQDVHAIDKVSPNKCTNIADLPWVILRKIISVDSSFRDEVLEELFEKMQDDSEVIPKSDDEKDNKGTIDEERISLFSLHPSDVFFTIFLCCDMFLQKTIMTKLSFCQFAVPFVYPRIYDDSLMMSLWSLRDIYIDDVQSLPTSSTKRVSFIRLGEVNEQSKSKLIDEFLRDQNEEHSTFYHHDCPLGENLRLVSNGIIEMSWFIPSIDDKKWAVSKEGAGENKSLTEPTLVFNLRGDGALHVRQVQILSEVTDIMVVLAEVESMDDEKNCDMLREIHRNTFIILLVSSKIKDNKTRDKIANTYRESLKTDEEKTSVLFLFDNKKKKNASKRRTMLRSEVQSMMKKVKPPKPLEQICSKLKLKINIDEMVLDCQKGKEFADSLFKTVIKDEESIEPRKEILPLQGDDLWVKWSHLLKEKSRIKTNVEGKTTDEPEYREMESIRLKQIETCHPFMARFIEVIFTLRKNKRTLLFFLDWTKHILEMLSKLKLPSLEKSFSEAFEKYEKSRSESDKSNVQKKKRELRDALFGIEHIFLELSQIYESFIRQGEKKDTFIAEKTMIILTAIPHIVSDLFLSGQILQILDGEASNVPLTWLQSVFDCIRLRKGNVKFTSVSILGIQSSGKSTLLNSMFGIQFNVSAGRCTRGVYTQLIPVRSKSTLKSDYLMVIDTEGLRAPELSDYSFNHDNELATFAIGFGDFALINIKGETISDMKDVLEIVVHGLLRLKQANQSLQFNQSCTFIHQNVSAKDAKDKMLQGHQETLKTLDDITKEIAESEGIQGVNAFKDVLEFHPHSSIKYVPDLWHGSPPMAPTSTKYSSKVQEIVDLIKLKMTETRNIHSVLDTSTRLHDLWKGILKEDFVFSFRNSLEVKAYNSLDIEFKKLGWEMEVAKQEWIDTNVVKGLNDLQRKEDLPKLISDLRIQFLFQMDKISQETKEKVSKFINEADSREQMIHWKERVIKRVDTLREELEIDYDKRVQEKSNICIVNFSEKSILSVNEKIINEKAQDLAKTLQRKQLSEDKLREYFEDMFEARMQEIEKENPSLPKEAEQNIEVGMRQDITTVLRHSYSNYSEKIRSQLQKRPLTGEEEYTTLADIFSNTTQTQTSSPWHLSWSWPFSDKKKKVWKTNVAHILNDIEFRINRERATRFRLSKTEFSIILKHAQDLISTSNQRKHDLNININVEIDIAVLVSRRCYHVFVRHNKEVLQQNSLRNKLGKIKEKTFKRFTNTVRQKHKDLTAADLLSDDLAEIIWNKMVQESKMQLKTWILRRYNFSKFNLMKDLLTKLVEKSYFESFVEFIKFPASYVLRFIITEAQQDFLERKGDSSSCKFKDWAYSFVSEKIDYIITTLDSYCKISENESPDTWLSEFAEALSEAKFDLSNDPLLQLKDFAITDFVQFKKSVTEHLYAKQNLLYEKISSFDLSDMEEIDDSPFEKAFSVLW